MSVWRNLLSKLLPFLFKAGEAAAEAAVEKKDPKQAALDAVANEDTSAVVSAATDVAVKTVKSVKGK